MSNSKIELPPEADLERTITMIRKMPREKQLSVVAFIAGMDVQRNLMAERGESDECV